MTGWKKKMQGGIISTGFCSKRSDRRQKQLMFFKISEKVSLQRTNTKWESLIVPTKFNEKPPTYDSIYTSTVLWQNIVGSPSGFMKGDTEGKLNPGWGTKRGVKGEAQKIFRPYIFRSLVSRPRLVCHSCLLTYLMFLRKTATAFTAIQRVYAYILYTHRSMRPHFCLSTTCPNLYQCFSTNGVEHKCGVWWYSWDSPNPLHLSLKPSIQHDNATWFQPLGFLFLFIF